MRKRKTAHNYWDFNQDIQEKYLNLRYQLGYLIAGYYLRSAINTINLLKVIGIIAIAQVQREFILKDFNKIFKTKNEKNKES